MDQQKIIIRATNQKILEHVEKARLNAESLYKIYGEAEDKEKVKIYIAIADKLLDIYHAVSAEVNEDASLVIFEDD